MVFKGLALGALALPLLCSLARAEDWDPRSTREHPCGLGAPPRGHAVREIASAGGKLDLTLTVKQDGDRLCYVADGNAEAPVLRLKPGDQLQVTLVNEIADPHPLQLFQSKPKLDEPNRPVPRQADFYPVVPGTTHLPTGRTNLHLHGFAVPPTAPADEVLQRCADPATGSSACGTHELVYRYVLPRDMPAGLYWYHPHSHGETEAQVALGLSGAVVVEGPADAARRARGIADRVLIVRQIDEPDEVKPPVDPSIGTMDHMAMPAAPATANKPARIDTAHAVLCGSSEDAGLLTLNGALVEKLPHGDADLAPLAIPAGGKQLWRIVNTSGDAYLDLMLRDEKGAAVPIEMVARDAVAPVDDHGHALPIRPTREAQLVPPAGRLEFLVTAPPPGAKQMLVSRAVDTGCAGDPVPERALALVTAGPAAAPAPADAETQHSSAPQRVADSFYDGLIARKPDRRRTIAFAEYPRPGTRDETDFYIAELKPGAVLRPFEMDGPPEITTRAGSVEEWTIENWSHELHAFHIHQVHFRVLSVNGRKVPGTPLLDTVNIPFATPDSDDPKARLTPGRVRIKLVFPPELAGDIPFHCHLLDHEDNGMMAVIRILPRDGAAPASASAAPVHAAHMMPSPAAPGR